MCLCGWRKKIRPDSSHFATICKKFYNKGLKLARSTNYRNIEDMFKVMVNHLILDFWLCCYPCQVEKKKKDLFYWKVVTGLHIPCRNLISGIFCMDQCFGRENTSKILAVVLSHPSSHQEHSDCSSCVHEKKTTTRTVLSCLLPASGMSDGQQLLWSLSFQRRW